MEIRKHKKRKENRSSSPSSMAEDDLEIARKIDTKNMYVQFEAADERSTKGRQKQPVALRKRSAQGD